MARKHIEDDEGILVEEPEDEEWHDEAEERKDKATRDWDEEAEGDEDDDGTERGGVVLGRLYRTPFDRGGSSDADVAARLQSPQALTEQELRHHAGYKDPQWSPPTRPVQSIIKTLAKLEVIGGYRRTYDVFTDWLNLVEATLHMLPQQMLYARLHGTLMPPEEEPAEIQEGFQRVRSHYPADRWQDAFKLFHEAYEILTDAAQGAVADWLGAMYMATNLKSARNGQFFTPWNVSYMIAQISMLDIEAMALSNMAEAIDAWEGSESYRTIGMQWGPEHPNTTRWIWEKHVDPLYLLTRHITVGEPAAGSGVMLLAGIASVPPYLTNYQLIDYFAIDIDPICAQMTRIQLLLYGANGYALLCQLPMHAPDDDLPTFEQLEHRYQQIASHVQCANALSHDWHRQEDGIWTMLPWYETERGKRHLAEMEEKDRQAVTEAAARKEQAKQKAKVTQVKEKAKKRGQELLFDIEVPPPEVQVQAAAAIAGVEVEPATNGHVNGDGNGHNGNGNGHTPGAAGDWTTFVERAKASKDQITAKQRKELEKAVEQMAENLTQETMF